MDIHNKAPLHISMVIHNWIMDIHNWNQQNPWKLFDALSAFISHGKYGTWKISGHTIQILIKE